MLPENLSDSYARYKQDTDVFATWLHASAESCGYTCSNPHLKAETKPTSSGRLKGKARKDAAASTQKDISKPTKITTREILDRANLVAASKKPRIQVPILIQRVLQRCIDVRTRCTSWFQAIEGASESRSTEKHRFFTDILSQALKILEPCYEKSKPKTGKLPPVSVSLENRFEGLHLEELDDIDLDTMVTNFVEATYKGISKSTSSISAKITSHKCELDLEPEAELPFIICCYFEDLHRTRQFLNETWQKLADNDGINLLTASLITNLALDQVRQAELEIIAMAQDTLPKKSSYQPMVSLISGEALVCDIEKRSKKCTSLDKDGSRATDFESFVFHSIFLTLRKYEESKDLPINSIQTISVQSTKGTEDASKNPDWEAEDKSLSQMILENEFNPANEFFDNVFLRMGLGEEDDRNSSPFKDILTQGIMGFLALSEIPTWFIFAARVMLDIQKILGPRTEDCYTELRLRGATAKSIINIEYKAPGVPELELEGTEYAKIWGGRDIATQAMTLSSYIKKVIKEDGMIWTKQRFANDHPGFWDREYRETDILVTAAAEFENMPAGICDFLLGDTAGDFVNGLYYDDDEDLLDFVPESAVEEIQSSSKVSPQDKLMENLPQDTTPDEVDVPRTILSSDPAYYHNQNPVYCGLESLRLATYMQVLSLNTANRFISVIAIANLYNALQYKKTLKHKWGILEQAMILHKDQLFTGKEFPKTPKEILNRYLLTLGCPASLFAINHRAINNKKFIPKVRNACRKRIEPAGYSEAIQGYVENSMSAEKVLLKLDFERCKALGEKEKAPITSLDTLRKVRDWLSQPDGLARMQTDWITLNQQSYVLF